MFFEGIRSERQLIATASLNLAHRWYLGYALDEDLPDHSCLTRIANKPATWVADTFTVSASESTASRATSGRPDPVPTQATRVTALHDSRAPLPPISSGSTEQVEPV